MKKFSIAAVIVLVASTAANADDHNKTWAKFFAGKWVIVGGESKGEVDLKLVAKGTSVIGTGKDAEGRESAWILGWDVVANRAIHAWFGDEGENGYVVYEVVDETTLRGPGVSRGPDGVSKGTVTLKRTGDDRYTVQWREVTTDGEEGEDLNLVVERLK
jgi:hypothetical protein